MVKHDTILEQLVHLRTGKALDERLKGNKCRCYQDALKQQDFAFAKLEKVKWSRGQSMHGRQEERKYKFWKIAGNLIMLLMSNRYNKI